ncbi:HMG domain-containing protein [Cryptosporidium ubiquitum]|uniref:HMG domain-containing protein n=1 Tax=Cryptosporidium ubiquitum TaxID=857276 RepID=A0A1J4MEP8_9CRYT|nr:HMG domain-containing protein [Cryptosporidium ubiquitum]OII72471.1 HMG domain-containing protein [Cryptosporidium ubiquitum]
MGYGGVNQKALEARERKQAAALEKKRREEEHAENERWRDDDKHANRKIERRREALNKQEEKQQKKQELRKLYEEEDSKIVSNKSKTTTGNKLTKAEIAKRTLMFAMQSSTGISRNKGEEFAQDDLLVENPNRIEKEMRVETESKNIEYISASTLDEALLAFGIDEKPSGDMHPEKRQKAAWLAYVDNNLPILKNENPTLKRSQLLQMLQKSWKKAPENPMNENPKLT